MKIKKILKDKSFWALFLTNVVVIILAVLQRQNFMAVMWVYCVQGVIIIFFNFIRILQLKEFSTENIKISVNNKPADWAPSKIKIHIIFLYIFSYFFTYSVVFLVLFMISFPDWVLRNLPFLSFDPKFPLIAEKLGIDTINWFFVIFTSLLFFINHLYSYIYNRPKDTKKQSIGTLFGYPLIRMLQIFFLPLFVWFAVIGLPIIPFLCMKTLTDSLTHEIEHEIRRGEAPSNTSGMK